MPKDQGGLDFRRLLEFNLALWAKQGWRLISEPDSLAAKTLKQRYFSNSDFFHSELGNNPSFTWKSIWTAKELLQKGCRRRIGSGDETFVYHHP